MLEFQAQDLTNQNLHYNKIPRQCLCRRVSENTNPQLLTMQVFHCLTQINLSKCTLNPNPFPFLKSYELSPWISPSLLNFINLSMIQSRFLNPGYVIQSTRNFQYLTDVQANSRIIKSEFLKVGHRYNYVFKFFSEIVESDCQRLWEDGREGQR